MRTNIPHLVCCIKARATSLDAPPSLFEMGIGQTFAGFSLFVTFCGASMAQESVFKAQSPLVLVPVTVSAKDGERIWGLESGDFQLLDNGRERAVKVEPWGTYESKISLVVVIETSALSHSALLKVKKTAAMLDSITGQGGQVAVITADREVQTLLSFTELGADSRNV